MSPCGWYLRLRHSKTGAGLPLQQRSQPAGLLLLRAVTHQELHVPRVWGRAVKYLKRKRIKVTPGSMFNTPDTQEVCTRASSKSRAL